MVKRNSGSISTPKSGSTLGSLLRLDIHQLYLLRSRSNVDERSLVNALYALGARLEKIGRKKQHRFRLMACPPLNLWTLAFPPGKSNSEIIHRAYLSGLWRERGLLDRAGLLVGLVLWSIPVNLLAILWMTAVNGRSIGRLRNKSTGRLLREQMQLAFRHNIMAPWYFQFELYDDAKRARAGDYLHRFELKGGLFRLVNGLAQPCRKSPLNNKEAFRQACCAAGLPTLPEVGIARDGQVLDRAGVRIVFPPGDLFIKPCVGRGGMLAERWQYAGDHCWRSAGGELLTAEALLQHVIKLSASRACVIQKRVVLHHAIADLSNGALATVRVLTMRNETGSFEPVVAAFRMAVGENHTTDNFHAGGIAANIELSSGILGPATDLGLRLAVGWLDQHPDTHAQITGRALPYWPEVLELARRAHGALDQRLVTGWDIAILEDGPALVEGNAAPGTDMPQRVSGEPLGAGRFGALFAGLVAEALSRPKGAE